VSISSRKRERVEVAVERELKTIEGTTTNRGILF